ncbi:MAG TPA: sigma-70 family RNA polymerase sigma factor, partial [Gaiellaceae bacterium]|nr:sigma-70 family RNA polymerase sigma factor [Gaiellaceae bacterium]
MTDPAAEAFERHYASVYRFVRRRAAGREEAEDLTQEVFAAAVAALDDARVESPPPLSWLYTVARRRLIDAGRRGRFVSVTGEEPPAGDTVYGAGVPRLWPEPSPSFPRRNAKSSSGSCGKGGAWRRSPGDWERVRPLARCASRAGSRSCAI